VLAISPEPDFNMHEWRILLGSVFYILIVSRVVNFLVDMKVDLIRTIHPVRTPTD